MSSNTTISIGWKIEDAGNGFQTVTMSAEDLRRVLRATAEESERVQRNFVNFAAVCTSIDSVSSTIDSLKSVVDDLAGAYDIQIEAETKLEQVMRNTMGATEEQIQSIKDFCSEQQKIGVVGDEVQLAGAQELATYVTMEGSLKRLIPVMNDMLVQQNGLAASGEAAAQIAGMLGKVLDGQTGALSRYGYKFDEAQEKILKYGTEEERVATLAEVVSKSVGGMNQTMAQTESGRMQQYANNLGDVNEQLGGIVKRVQIPLTLAANCTIALGGVVKLVKGLKDLVMVLNLTKAATGWIGLAIVAAGTALAWFLSRTEETANSLDILSTAEERANRASEMAADRLQTETDARKSAEASLTYYISKTEQFNGTKKEEKKLVTELNDTYGRTMGYFKSVAEWYQALIKNSKAYCDQMVNEAKARMLANQIAELEINRDKIVKDDKGKARMYSKEKKYKTEVFDKEYFERYGIRRMKAIYHDSDWEKATAAVNDYNEKIKYLKENLNKTQSAKIEMPLMGAAEPPEEEKGAGKQNQEKTRLQEINKLLQKYNEEYQKASESQKVVIKEKVAILLKEKNAIELTQAELQRPLSFDSLSDYNKEIAYQTKLREIATAEQVAGIDKTIARLNQEKLAFELASRGEMTCLSDYSKELSRLQGMREEVSADQIKEIQAAIGALEEEKEAFERAAHVRISPDKITSYKELEAEIQFCNELLKVGTDEEKKWATANLPLFRKKEQAMSAAIASIGVAQKPEDAGSLEEISAAISLLDDKIQRASADEIDSLTRTRMAFERKKEAYERGIKIPEMEKEVNNILKLPDNIMKVKISSIGFDELNDKIRDIRKQLDDLDNPPTAGQRKSLEGLMATYEEWRRECALSFSTLDDGWGSIKSIASGLENLGSVVSESGNAWTMMTGIIDNFIQLYQGIESVVSILEMIGVISKANTVAKTAEAAATGSSAVAMGVESAAAEGAALAQIPVIAANEAATASYLELAASEYMAAHASIPFAGFGIGSAFASSAAAFVKGIGVTAFANGGIVSGPTLGLVGEYAGASSNPEVIAPLDKLKDIIGTTQRGAPVIIGGRVEIDGRKLAVVLENQTRIAGVSGRRYK